VAREPRGEASVGQLGERRPLEGDRRDPGALAVAEQAEELAQERQRVTPVLALVKTQRPAHLARHLGPPRQRPVQQGWQLVVERERHHARPVARLREEGVDPGLRLAPRAQPGAAQEQLLLATGRDEGSGRGHPTRFGARRYGLRAGASTRATRWVSAERT